MVLSILKEPKQNVKRYLLNVKFYGLLSKKYIRLNEKL